ncbi:MAG: GGDEF domain-containing protein [Candidatus Peregrinibacteria bacterium]
MAELLGRIAKGKLEQNPLVDTETQKILEKLATADRQKILDILTTDQPTQLKTKDFFDKALEADVERAKRGQALSMLFLDIDHFKDINDTWGHPKGDEVLKAVAEIILKTPREVDIKCRIGGEEMAIILPGTDLNGAQVLAEKIRKKIEEEVARQFPEIQEKRGITVSIGCAEFSRENNNAQSLKKAADTALYAAKQGGRNCVKTFPLEQAESPAEAGNRAIAERLTRSPADMAQFIANIGREDAKRALEALTEIGALPQDPREKIARLRQLLREAETAEGTNG